MLCIDLINDNTQSPRMDAWKLRHAWKRTTRSCGRDKPLPWHTRHHSEAQLRQTYNQIPPFSYVKPTLCVFQERFTKYGKRRRLQPFTKRMLADSPIQCCFGLRTIVTASYPVIYTGTSPFTTSVKSRDPFNTMFVAFLKIRISMLLLLHSNSR